jgi:type VI secretion system (T6SS) effector TldE1-like protein
MTPCIQFQISTGTVSQIDDDGTLVLGEGYSGAPGYVNDPSAVSLQGEGPIPMGTYTIEQPINDATTGPFSLPLTPSPENEMFGRSGFLIHGADAAKDVNGAQLSSHGCIVCARPIRQVISGFQTLVVVA